VDEMKAFNATILLISMFSLAAFSPVVDAGCSCGGNTWDPYAFLNSELGVVESTQPGGTQDNAKGSVSKMQKPFDRIETYVNSGIFKPMKSVSSSDVVIDVSNGDSYATSHIKDAIHIPTKSFLNIEGNLKTEEELAKILGDAGVSRKDSVVLYAGKESTGEAEFAFLVLRYLGQTDARILAGSLEDWKAAGLPDDVSENKRSSVEYKPQVNSDVMAEYEYVKSGQAQIVDVRPFVDFGKGRIPGSIALDSTNVIKGDKIKNGKDLGIVFSRLQKDKPIVVYSDDFSRSALVAYSLLLMGYEASIYTWKDWRTNEAANEKAEAKKPGEDPIGSKYTKLGTT
jgi:3-mercaptopyruvate sulfurtransferase SseA